ncbi:MAG: sodium-dependent transporter [Candidatus Nitronauta litoralis]|uniref:Transporter n=1 Tax=Candidatus Nitronauta litoralis TaxID=2705533 RepID=A0A7T0BVZ0_9BACT|nr:MAG: sodium-dependent transporter [Candidatus Nitronauta litoralis]
MKVDSGNNRGLWGTRLGFILAASGSAVGLGNVWKFPYITGQNGGGAFVIIYLLCIVVVGLPIMLAEFTIGRRTGLNPVGAFRKLAPNTPWVIIGFMGVLAGFLILSFYAVVGGWTLAYVTKSLTGNVSFFSSSEASGKFFGNFISDTPMVLLYHTIFMGITMAIVIRGIRGGIEKACDILMPTLVFMLVVLMIRSLTLDGAMEGVKFYLTPDFSKINGSVILMAMGQAFFSLSLGMGCLITYASYLPPEENLTSATVYVVLFDTFIALLMGMVIFPAVFAVGMQPTEGPSLVFTVLPTVFAQMPMGGIVAIGFFSLLAIAALTSAISLLEAVVAFFIDQFGWKRKNAVVTLGIIIYLFGIPSGLSFGLWNDVTFFGKTFFDVVDNIASNYLLPLGGLLTAIFVGWWWGTDKAHQEIERHETKFHWARAWEFLIKYVSPIAVLFVFLGRFF